MYLAEKCADIYSRLKRNQQSKNYYLKQVKINFFINVDQRKEDIIFLQYEFYLVKTCTRIKFK